MAGLPAEMRVVENDNLLHFETTADLILHYFSLLGIDTVFGVPGGAIEPMYNALARAERDGTMRSVVARHEAGAAFMADGYARERGIPGVCISTTGPGATNLVTGVSSAYADNIPMLVITAQTALPNFGKRALQDSSCTAVNTVGMFKHCTVYNTLVSHPEQLEQKLIAAINAAQGQRPGPAHVSIPLDILNSPLPGRPLPISAYALKRAYNQYDAGAVDELSTHLGQAQKIALFLGRGCQEAIESILNFANKVNADIVTTPSGKGLLASHHPKYRGVFGFAGHESATQALMEGNDIILAVGTDMDELGTSNWNTEVLLNSKLIHIDQIEEHFNRSPMARMHVCGRIKSIFEHLNRDVDKALQWGRSWDSGKQAYHPSFPDMLGYDRQATPVDPKALFAKLPLFVSDDTRYYVDAGNAWAWATHYLQLPKANRYRIGMGFGAMAWAIGAAVGAAMADPEKPAICITGDGSFLMSGQEMTVALQHQLPVVFIILNDSALGMVKHGQRMGGAEQIGFELPTIDFALMAQSMGIQSQQIHSMKDFDNLNLNELTQNGPVLLDVRIDGEQKPPMGSRVKTLTGE
ncbi:MAG: acetolactate synthase [Kangiellaceae bacterium]|nr:acetolactate synthase [Kangiellaceae bacterium]|tara:strand:- start:7114 stop:8853 length:1740 start_codon:yes stop_codon:yes gene_type:complete